MDAAILNEFGLAIYFNDYEDLVIPQNCIGFTDRAYEDFYATANIRRSISVEIGNKKYKSVNNCLIEIEKGKVVLGCKNSSIPDDGSIKIIGHHAFIGIGDIECKNRDIFNHINIPKGVEIIEHHAFADSGIVNVNLPDGLKEIGSMAFMLTRIGKGNKRVLLPDTIEKLGIGVFMGCKELARPTVFSNRYTTDCDCIVDSETKSIVAVHNGIEGEALPYIADTVEELTFMGQNKGSKYYFDENIKEIRISPLGIPVSIEFPIIIVARKGSYAYEFAVKNGIDYEICK